MSKTRRVGGAVRPVRYVQLRKFEEMTGYTPAAVKMKMLRNDWTEGDQFMRAPDGRILIDLEGYEKWVRQLS
jgi:hypothetical protein